jgi:hypothetical protein
MRIWYRGTGLLTGNEQTIPLLRKTKSAGELCYGGWLDPFGCPEFLVDDIAFRQMVGTELVRFGYFRPTATTGF